MKLLEIPYRIVLFLVEVLCGFGSFISAGIMGILVGPRISVNGIPLVLYSTGIDVLLFLSISILLFALMFMVAREEERYRGEDWYA